MGTMLYSVQHDCGVLDFRLELKGVMYECLEMLRKGISDSCGRTDVVSFCKCSFAGNLALCFFYLMGCVTTPNGQFVLIMCSDQYFVLTLLYVYIHVYIGIVVVPFVVSSGHEGMRKASIHTACVSSRCCVFGDICN